MGGNDGTLLIRIFEYASQIALDDGSVETENNDSKSEVTLTVDFPHSAVICLRSRKKTAQKWSIRMRTPGGECCYQVPVIYIKEYGIEEMFRKKLYFLIPFYIFNLEAELPDIEAKEDRLRELCGDYQKMLERLSGLEEAGEISTFSYETLRDMTKKVVFHLAEKQENVRKGIGDIMGGEVLDFEAKRIRDQARLEGWQTGKAEGWQAGQTDGEGIKLVKLVYLKLKKGQKPEVIADALEERITNIKKICTAIRAAGSDFSAEEVYQKLKEPEQTASERTERDFQAPQGN